MPLPKIDLPTFKATLPSNGKEIRYRAFNVKEEKILLMAASDKKDENDGSEVEAIKQIINNCVLNDDFDVEKIPFFDFEYIFLLIRAKSVGEVIEVRYRHTENDCNRNNDVEIDLSNVELSEKPKDGKIMLSENFGIKLRYPTVDEVSKYENQNLSKVFDLIGNLVEYVFDKERIYQPEEDYSNEELETWIGSLSKDQGKELVRFLSNMPRIQTKIDFKCSKCGKELSAEVKGLSDFFQ